MASPVRLLFVVCTLLVLGCEETARNVDSRPHVPAAAKSPSKAGSIIGQRTQEIRNAATELQTGKAKVASTKIVAKDYITIQGNAYVATVGRLAIMAIHEALELYRATNDRYPKNLDEFMNEIIKANNIALPKLPPYQAYGYDEQEHKLVVLEYPNLKAQAAP